MHLKGLICMQEITKVLLTWSKWNTLAIYILFPVVWQNVEAFAGAVLYNRKVHSFVFCQESFRSAVRDMAQKDTRHFESVKFKWLKRMHYYYLERSDQLTWCLAISKKKPNSCPWENVRWDISPYWGETTSVWKVGRGLPHNRNEL